MISRISPSYPEIPGASVSSLSNAIVLSAITPLLFTGSAIFDGIVLMSLIISCKKEKLNESFPEECNDV
jgi:hypothetical protein